MATLLESSSLTEGTQDALLKITEYKDALGFVVELMRGSTPYNFRLRHCSEGFEVDMWDIGEERSVSFQAKTCRELGRLMANTSLEWGS